MPADDPFAYQTPVVNPDDVDAATAAIRARTNASYDPTAGGVSVPIPLSPFAGQPNSSGSSSSLPPPAPALMIPEQKISAPYPPLRIPEQEISAPLRVREQTISAPTPPLRIPEQVIANEQPMRLPEQEIRGNRRFDAMDPTSGIGPDGSRYVRTDDKSGIASGLHPVIEEESGKPKEKKYDSVDDIKKAFPGVELTAVKLSDGTTTYTDSTGRPLGTVGTPAASKSTTTARSASAMQSAMGGAKSDSPVSGSGAAPTASDAWHDDPNVERRIVKTGEDQYGFEYVDKRTGEPIKTDAKGNPILPWNDKSPLGRFEYAKKVLNSARNRYEQAELNARSNQLEIDNQTVGEIQRKMPEIEAKTKEIRDDEVKFETAYKEGLDKVKNAKAELANMKYDGRSYIEKNPLSGIMFAISAALGGALAARTGQPNTALSAIDNAIERDIRMQEMQMKKKQHDVDNQDNLLAQMVKQYGDLRTAKMATRSLMKEEVSMKMGEMESIAKNQELRDSIGTQRAKFDLARAQDDHDMALRYAQASMKPTGTGAMKPPPGMVYVPAARGFVPEKSAEEVKRANYAFDEINRSIGNIIDLSKKLNTYDRFKGKAELGKSSDYITLKSEVESAKRMIAHLPHIASGALAAGESKEFEDVLGSVLDVNLFGTDEVDAQGNSVSPAVAAAMRIQNRFKSSWDNYNKSAATIPGVEGVAMDPATGRINRVGGFTGEQPSLPASSKPVDRSKRTPIK